jgi:predicted Zn-dependent peptidase
MYHKSTLENGIRVVTESMPSVRSVAMGIVVDAGLCNEQPQKNGLAHLVEHLMFQGTRNRDSLQIAHFMDEAGGRIGGFTTRDYTCYSATVLDDYRTFALDLLGDILLNSIFLPDDIEMEKETVLREIDAFFDQPDNRADALLKSHTWADHPLGRPIIGKRDTISAITRQDVTDYFNTNYQPDRLIVAAAGNLEHDDFVSQVRDAFWRMQAHPRQDTDCPLEYHAGIAVEYMPVTQTYFSIGIQAPHYSHRDRYGLHILNKIIGDGISARLFQKIRKEYGLVYHIGSEYQAYRDGGLLVIEGSTKPLCFQKVLGQTLAVLQGLINGDDPVQPEELLRAKSRIKGHHLIASEDTSTRMNRLATQEFYFGRHISTREIAEQIEAVDVKCLETITQQSLAGNLSKMAMAIVGPHNSERHHVLVNEVIQVSSSLPAQKKEVPHKYGALCTNGLDKTSQKPQHLVECR